MGWGSALRNPTRAKPGPHKKVAKEVSAAWRPKYELPHVEWKQLVTLDFETYYDDDFTLKKLSTSEYIRDPRFEVIMCGIKVGTGKTRVYRGAAETREALAAIDWSTHAVLCHHTQFDGLILSHHFGVVPSRYYCSLSMARGWLSNDIGAGLDEVSKYFGRGGKHDEGKALINMKGVRLADMHPEVYKKGAVYCAQDVDETLLAFEDLLSDFSQPELDLIDATVQMFTCPVLQLDEARAKKALAAEIEERKRLILEVAPEGVTLESMESAWRREYRETGGTTEETLRLFAGKKVLGSSTRFAALLEAEGIDPPLKISPTWLKKKPEERDPDKQFTYAFAKDDPAMQELLDDENPRVRALCEARIAVKSNTSITRAERLLRSGAGGRAMPVYYKFAGAHTWRFSGGDKQNWQNFKRGGELRLSILAPKGYHLVVADSSQIEARVNAWLWGQDDLIEAFRRGEDIYSLFATENIYGYEVTKSEKTKKERHVGKTAILGLGFQMGAKKFRATLARGVGGPPVQISEEQAQLIVQAYRRRYAYIKEGWAICESIIEDMATGRQGEWKCIRWDRETIWLPNGMRLKYPGLKMDEEGNWTYRRKGNVIKLYGGLLCENIVQALARIIVAAEQLLAVAKVYPVVMTTHDEVVALAKKRMADACQKFMEKIMFTPPPWAPDLPVACEAGHAPNYSK